VIPLVRREFDGSHCGLRHTLGEMTTVCGKCPTLFGGMCRIKFPCQSEVYSMLRAR
jgi:hypothetical protein